VRRGALVPPLRQCTSRSPPPPPLVSLAAQLSMALPQTQLSRLMDLRHAILSSSPMRAAAARLADLQTAPPSGAESAAASPGVTVGSGSSSLAGGGGAGPVARLTEESAAASLALNTCLLAVVAVARLRNDLLPEVGAVFSEEKCVPPAVWTGGEGREGGGPGGEVFETACAWHPPRRDARKVRSCLDGLVDVCVHVRRVLDAGLKSLLERLTPRLRTALHVYDGASSLVRYDVSEGEWETLSSDPHANVVHAELLPVLAAIIAPLQVSAAAVGGTGMLCLVPATSASLRAPPSAAIPGAAPRRHTADSRCGCGGSGFGAPPAPQARQSTGRPAAGWRHAIPGAFLCGPRAVSGGSTGEGPVCAAAASGAAAQLRHPSRCGGCVARPARRWWRRRVGTDG